MPRLAVLAIALAANSLAACAPGYEEPTSPRALMRFNSELAGLTPGQPRSCLPPRSNASVVAARGGTLLFRDGNTVYASATSGGCAAAADNSYALVTNNFGTGSLCRGTIAQVVDLTAGGILKGSCALGDFTPYRRR